MTGGVVELDLHGMNTYQAQIAVDAALRRAGNGTYRLRLIHGYRGGTAIRDMLWLTYGRRSPGEAHGQRQRGRHGAGAAGVLLRNDFLERGVKV